MTTKTFSISESIRFGWETFLENILFLFLLGLVIIGTNVVAILLDTLTLGLASIIFQIIAAMGTIVIKLKLVDNRKPELMDLFKTYKPFFKYLLASLLVAIIVFVGFVLLIVPGIIFGLMYQFTSFFIVDKGLKPIAAMKASAALTKGVKWHLFRFGLLVFLINVAAAMLFAIGLLVTLPTTAIAHAYIYRKLLAQTSNTSSDPVINTPASPDPQTTSTSPQAPVQEA